MNCYYINIGSNLGQRRLNVARAVSAVGDVFGDRTGNPLTDCHTSHILETPAWGFESANDFLNIGMCFQSDLSPAEVLERLKEIERLISDAPHRNEDGTYRDRVIDIDIVAIDNLVLDTPELKVPHPRLAEREFFLRPMKELAPAWRHPVTGLSAAEMLEKLAAE